MTKFSNNMKLLASSMVALVFALAVYFLLIFINATGARFFGIEVFLSINVACLVSPKWDISLGAKRLWLLDWIGAMGVSVFCIFMKPDDPVLARIIRFFCFAIFFVSAGIFARRGRSGRS